MSQSQLFHHHSTDRDAPADLYLFHGTGGDEHDLLPLVDKISDFNIMSLRGNVSENGLNRFFRRDGFGVFDQKNIKQEAAKLYQCINQLSASKPISALGYSNGANFVLAAMFYHPNLFSKAVLLHPMLPFNPKDINLSNLNALVTYGSSDTMITPQQSHQVIDILKASGATVKVLETPGGHQLHPSEITAIHQFL